MIDWIVIAVLYAFVIVFFRALGGIASAGEALKSWGRTSARLPGDRRSPDGA